MHTRHGVCVEMRDQPFIVLCFPLFMVSPVYATVVLAGKLLQTLLSLSPQEYWDYRCVPLLGLFMWILGD